MLKVEQINSICKRADDAVNGFTTVPLQCARDVLRLTAHIAELQHMYDHALATIGEMKAKEHGSYSAAFDSIFKDIKGQSNV